MNLLRRFLRFATLGLALLCLALLIIWGISTRWYVYANVLLWNGVGSDLGFAGFTSGSLIYGTGNIQTNEPAYIPTIAFHCVARPAGWGLWLPTEAEQRSIVRNAVGRTYQYLYFRQARCLPLWIPTTLVAIAAATCFVLQRILARGRARARNARGSGWRSTLKFAGVVACVLCLGLWTLNLVGTLLKTRLTAILCSVECANAGYGICLVHGGLHLSYTNYAIAPPRFYVTFDSAWYRPHNFTDFGFDLPGLWSFNPGAPVSSHVQIVFRLPLWIPLLLCALATTFVVARDRKLVRRATGCTRCGYDLTGNLSGRCPECGAPADGLTKP